jgi:outer membrane protein assembly factor BamB
VRWAAVALAFGLAVAPGAIAVPPAAPESVPALAVMPFPGTPDASPASEVIFSALRPSELRTVTVSGTRTGLHTGRLTALPAGAGTAWVPAHRFASGETVSVTAKLSSGSAGTASGDPGSTRLRFSFRVVRPLAEPAPGMARTSLSHASSGRSQTFHSVPQLHPPLVSMARPDPGGGDIFTTPVNGSQRGPMIINGRGQLVWYHRTGRDTTFNFEKQQYRGRPVLTWWQGHVVHGHGAAGQDVIMDSSYRQVAVLHAGHGYSSDLHEFQLAPHGRALIDAYTVVPANLSSVGGPSDGRVLDCVIQELDIRTGRVLWEWHALGHVPLSASYGGVPSDQTPFDFFHLNSIQQLSGNRLIISGRNTWSVYMLDERTGRVIWTLGGKDSSWRMGSGTNFEWQHDARLHRRGLLTVFDDGAGPSQEESESSVKELFVNVNSGLVSLVKRFTHSPPKLAGSQGNADLMSNGNVMIGWGSGGGFSEYTAGGREILDGGFPIGINSYRAYRYGWTGHPAKPPALAAVPAADGSVKVYASWNGDTQVASWEVLGGASRQKLFRVTERRPHGFETAIQLHNEPRFFAVRALDTKGQTLGQSLNIPLPSHIAIFGATAFVNTSTRLAAIPVACFAPSACHLTMRVRAGNSAIGPSHPATVRPGSIVLIAFQLSPAGVQKLGQARRLRVQVGVRRAGGPGSSRQLMLVPYSTSGTSPAQSVSQAPSIQLVGTRELVSSRHTGGILAACYGPAPCLVGARISADNTVIASPDPRYLGVGEAAYLPFKLNPAGQTMLANASGNQLAARVTLTNAGSVASGRVALSRYS